MSSKPRRNRACDSCRKKKARCNGSDMPDGRCATCITYSVECTYSDPPKRATQKGYVQVLETRLAKLERLVQRYSSPDTLGSPLSSMTHDPTTGSDSTSEDEARVQPKLSPLPARAYSKPSVIDPLSPLEEETTYSDDEFLTVAEMGPSKIPVEQVHENTRFYGKSSLLVLTSQVFSERRKETGVQDAPYRRKEFWTAPDWMSSILESPPAHLEYPDMDLMRHLVDRYFDNLNAILPLLHRPSFVRSIEEGLHKVDHNFGATVLLVCAIGCRYTNDPRVTHEITTSTSCTAWKFFSQTHHLKGVHYLPHSLHEAQLYPLAALFLEGYSPPETPWVVIGVGLRVMQDSGVHRKMFSSRQSLENELWKRAFWVLIVLDRSFSTLLGRSCALQDEDFDADLPLLCNDEDLGESGLKSPARPPTQMCCFVAAIKLNQILAFALRTLYSTKKSRDTLGYVGKQWEQHILAALDSALNKWMDTVPEHLRWGSEASQKDRTYLIQSAFLWSQFYEIQLHIHRIFALRDPPDPELTASSMIICKNAAKRCVGIIESAKEVLVIPLCAHVFIKPMFTSTIFLLLIFWKKKGIDYASSEYHAIEVAAEMVRLTSKRWRTSSCLSDILKFMRTMIDGPWSGRIPSHQDWYRVKFGSVLYVDKNGLASPMEANRGAHPKLPTNEEYNDHPSSTLESRRETYPTRGPTRNEPEALRQMLWMGGPTGYGAIQPGDLSPTDFFMNSPSISDSPETSAPSGPSGPEGPDTPDKINGINGRINGAHFAADSSSMLPMELMIYNELMTDIDGTTRFLGQEFQDSVLFGPASTSSPTPVGQYSDQDPPPQPPSTMYGFWERTLYDHCLNQLSKQTT